jgi:hypothetical protein
MAAPRPVGTLKVKPSVATSAAPAAWVRESGDLTGPFIELAADMAAMKTELERYGTQPSESFTRLDDFLAELDD